VPGAGVRFRVGSGNGPSIIGSGNGPSDIGSGNGLSDIGSGHAGPGAGLTQGRAGGTLARHLAAVRGSVAVWRMIGAGPGRNRLAGPPADPRR
jgi:hypothetical protein